MKILLLTKLNMTYRTVPRTARVPEYGARTFQVKDTKRSNIEAAWERLKDTGS